MSLDGNDTFHKIYKKEGVPMNVNDDMTVKLDYELPEYP